MSLEGLLGDKPPEDDGIGRAPATADNAVSSTIMNLLATSYNDSSLRDALAYLDGKVDIDNTDIRRQLRSDVESEVIAASGRVIKTYSKTAERLRHLGSRLKTINDLYQEMEDMVNGLHKESAHVFREAKELKQQQAELADKEILLDAFEQSFVILPHEVEVLRDFSSPPDDEFYAVMAKVNKIHNDCQVLLSAEDSEATGLEIMKATAEYMDVGYNKLFNAVQQQLKLMSGPHMRINRNLQSMLEQLSKRPLQFDEALNGLAETRQKNLYDEFISALTVESRGSKPLDFYAYDIKRYVGDIMAWVHAAIVGECEQFAALFQSDDSESISGRPWQVTNDPKRIIQQMVTKSTSGVIKPLRARIEQVLSSQEDLTTVYEVSGVLSFYHSMFLKNVAAGSPIEVAVAKLVESANLRFSRCLEAKVESVKGQLSIAKQHISDLQPPEFLLDATADMKAVLTSYETSISYSRQSARIGDAINDLTEPYLEFCRRIAADMNVIDSEIFLINCYDSVKSVLAVFSFASDKLDQLTTMVDELVEAIVDAQLRNFMVSSGMKDVKTAERASVRAFAPKLDEFLPAATMESGIDLQKLSSPRLASSITLRASLKFAEQYADLYDEVMSQYPNDHLLPRSVQEVKVLLALD